MRLAWFTDIHLNFVKSATRRSLLAAVAEKCDAVAITGDIGESDDVALYLSEMAEVWQRPIYFVLGNHDFYRGSITAMRENITDLAKESRYLVYLTATDIVELTPRTALIGHDGWADARLGDFDNSTVILSDYALIEELRFWKQGAELDKDRLRPVLQRLGDEAAGCLESRLTTAADRYEKVIVATHVPPFREATWHEGRVSDDNWLPHFSCQAVGEVILDVMSSRPDRELLVLCGHTHGGGTIEPLENVRVVTGPATYAQPEIQQIVDVL